MESTKRITINNSHGMTLTLPQEELVAIPTGTTFTFGTHAATTEVHLEQSTPAEARVLSPPQRRESRAYRARLHREQRVAAGNTQVVPQHSRCSAEQKAIKPSSGGQRWQVARGRIQKPPRISAFSRLSAMPIQESAPATDAMKQQPRADTSFSIMPAALSRTVCRNRAWRAHHRAMRDVSPHLPLKNTSAPMEYVPEESVVTCLEVDPMHGETSELAKYRQMGKAPAIKEGHPHQYSAARRSDLHQTAQQHSFKKRAPVATDPATSRHHHKVGPTYHTSIARSTHGYGSHGGAPARIIEWRPVRPIPTHVMREAAPTNHEGDVRSTPTRRLQEGAPASRKYHQHSSPSSQHHSDVQLEKNLRGQPLGECSKPFFQWQRKDHKIKPIIVAKPQQASKQLAEQLPEQPADAQQRPQHGVKTVNFYPSDDDLMFHEEMARLLK